MPLFGPPNIAKMKSRYNMKGLIKALNYEKDVQIQIQAARALAKLFSSPMTDNQSKQLILSQRDVVIREGYRGDAGIGDELARKDYPARTLGSYLKIVE